MDTEGFELDGEPYFDYNQILDEGSYMDDLANASHQFSFKYNTKVKIPTKTTLSAEDLLALEEENEYYGQTET